MLAKEPPSTPLVDIVIRNTSIYKPLLSPLNLKTTVCASGLFNSLFVNNIFVSGHNKIVVSNIFEWLEKLNIDFV